MSSSDLFLQDYLISLKDLTFNSGPIIHSLTVIAKENMKDHGGAVVEAIRQHLKSCPVKMRLPAMYLVDSILKNVGGIYKELFAPKIYEIFSECYRSVPEDIQKKLARLMTFWNDKFDASINQALKDFVARHQLKKKVIASQAPVGAPVRPVMPVFSHKQLNLLHLIQNLLVQKQQASMMMPGDAGIITQIQTLQQILRRLQTPLPDQQIDQITHQMALWSGPVSTFPPVAAPIHGYPPSRTAPGPPVGIGGESREKGTSRLKLSDITLSGDLNLNYKGAVETLYDNLALQCKQCGFRFRDDADGRTKNTAHLDWHFRQNRKMKDLIGKTQSRDWFLKESDWLEQSNVDTTSSQTPVFFDMQKEQEKEASNGATESAKRALPAIDTNAKLPLDEENQECAVCHEKFETFWDEEEEEWMMKDAVKVKEKIYHPACAKDLPDSPQTPRSPSRKRKKESNEYDFEEEYSFDV